MGASLRLTTIAEDGGASSRELELGADGGAVRGLLGVDPSGGESVTGKMGSESVTGGAAACALCPRRRFSDRAGPRGRTGGAEEKGCRS